MRLWHKDLIPVLPKQQLLAQWRECCCIARNIAVNGTPNHLLVNKILSYPIDHFIYYSGLIEREMKARGYSCDWSKFEKFGLVPQSEGKINCSLSNLYEGWHNNKYLIQCFCNLEEKFDCGGVPADEWEKIVCCFDVVKYINTKG